MFHIHRWIVFFSACFLIAFLALAGLLTPLGNAARFAFLPVVRLFSSVSQTVFSARSSVSCSIDRQNKLEADLASLAVDNAHLRALEEENQSLRLQAKFLASSGYDSVGARVISRDLSRGRALLLIDRGLVDRLEIGEAVVAEGIYIGKISSLKEQVATVELVSDPNSRVAASLTGERNVIGVLEGRGNGAAALTYIPPSQKLSADQVIVTAGTEDKIPQHLPLGMIDAVQGKPTDPFLTAAVEPLLRPERLTLVSVLRPTVLRPR